MLDNRNTNNYYQRKTISQETIKIKSPFVNKALHEIFSMHFTNV